MKLCVVYNLVVILLIAPSIILSHPQRSRLDEFVSALVGLATGVLKSQLQEAFRIIENEHTDCQFSTGVSGYVDVEPDTNNDKRFVKREEVRCSKGYTAGNWDCEVLTDYYHSEPVYYTGCACAYVAKDIIEERTNIDLDKGLNYDVYEDVVRFFKNFAAFKTCGTIQPTNGGTPLRQTSSVSGSGAINSFSPVGLSKKCTSPDLPCWFGSGQRCCQMRQWGRSKRWRCPKSC